MSKCFGCHFYECGYMWNGCSYFQSECYREPEECEAFSIDGKLTPEQQDAIFKASGGAFGEPLDKSQLPKIEEIDEGDWPFEREEK